MPLNFTDALDRKVEDIERPPLLPVGTYRWMVSKLPTNETIANGNYDVCDFTLKCLNAQDDVDTADLKEFEEKAGQLTNVYRRRRFMFDTNDEGSYNKALFQLKTFCIEHLEIEGGDKMSLKELLSKAQNHVCLGVIRWRPDKDNPEVFYDEISKTAPVGE